jgi:aspartokinase-like uncharacterized kinase
MSGPVVVKVGGSLYDLPDLGPRLRAWLDTLGTPEVLLVPGGGAAADVVRELDRVHGLGEEASHWLALRALQLNASFLATVLPRSVVVEDVEQRSTCWRQGRIPILDTYAFALADEGRPGCLPHTWEVTGDSLAARVAQVTGAGRLILLKSIPIPGGLSADAAADQGLVDEHFPSAVEAAGSAFAFQVVNFRKWRV